MTTGNDVFGDRLVVVTEERMQRALGWMEDNLSALALAIAHRQHMEQWIKTVEAQEKAKHKEEPAHVQEREARASEPYRLAIEAFRDASASEQRLRFFKDYAEIVIDVWRTQCANTRKL